jgi:ABC-type antimicrobial peptide transport system permease subunit
LIVRALRVISGLPLPFPGPSWHYLWAALGAIVVALLAAVYPMWRMLRASPARAVRSG